MAHEAREAQDRLALLRELLTLTQRALLMVDLDALAPLLDRKEALIQALQKLDAAAPAAGVTGEEQPRLLQAILENENALEARMGEEQKRVRKELRDLERQSRLRLYLERGDARSSKVDLKR